MALVRGRPVGVDVEAHRPLGDLLAMARSVMTGAELAAFQALPEEARAPAFFTLWTRKEAYMKATGAGFTLPPQSFAVQGLAGAGWTLRDLPVGGGFAACVAVRGPVDPLRYASWPPAPRAPGPLAGPKRPAPARRPCAPALPGRQRGGGAASGAPRPAGACR